MSKVAAKSQFTECELVVLQFLQEGRSKKGTFEISEIGAGIGLNDNDEILRALYTLEGRSLVTPDPEGNFTSKNWKITDDGVKALNFLAEG